MSVTRRNVSFAPDVWARLEKIGEVSPVVDRALRKYLGLPDATPPDRGANLRKVTRAEVLAAVEKHGSQAAAAVALGVHESTVSRHCRIEAGPQRFVCMAYVRPAKTACGLKRVSRRVPYSYTGEGVTCPRCRAALHLPPLAEENRPVPLATTDTPS